MVFQALTILLIVIEGLLIIVSFNYLCQISKVSRDFAVVFKKAKAEISLLFDKIQHLTTISGKKEDSILNVAFHLEDMELYIKKILSKFEQYEEDQVRKLTNKSNTVSTKNSKQRSRQRILNIKEER